MNKIIKKKEYKTPSVNVFEIEMEDVIAASGTGMPGEWDNGNPTQATTGTTTESNSRSNYYDRYSR